MITCCSFKTAIAMRVGMAGFVSIAMAAPGWYEGREYKQLSPPKFLQEWWGQNACAAKAHKYCNIYSDQVLRTLNPVTVVAQLGPEAVLLSWEHGFEFGHRAVVADWLIKAGYKVKMI